MCIILHLPSCLNKVDLLALMTYENDKIIQITPYDRNL